MAKATIIARGNALGYVYHLPEEERYLELRTVEELAEAIRSLRVRGAPLIGIAAAMGLARVAGQRGSREGREELKRVIDHLQHLPDDRRDALIMRFALGMDNREIARALGRTDGATKVLLHRAVKQLEDIVGFTRETTGATSRSARLAVGIRPPARPAISIANACE